MFILYELLVIYAYFEKKSFFSYLFYSYKS